MIGKTLAHYRILALVGRGGMGEVYRAQDLKLHRTVALKLLAPDLVGSRRARERLLREAYAGSKLNHANIATIYEVDEADGRFFISMEYVEGESLAERIERGPLPLEQVVAFGSQVAEALNAAHREGVIHRDVKPANILVGAGEQVKVVDFGLALEVLTAEEEASGKTKPTAAARLTRSGSAVGTVAYMSPEQARGQTLDFRTDLFSLGVVLFELATGSLPFEGGTPLAMAAAIIHDRPSAMTETDEVVSRGLREIITRCLDKDPLRRPSSALQVRDALRLLKEGHSTSRIRTVLGRKPWRVRAVIGVGLVTLAVAAGAMGFWISHRQAVEPVETIASLDARRAYAQACSYESRGVTLHDMGLAEQMFRRAHEAEPDNPFLKAHLARFLAKFEFEYPGDASRRDEIRTLADAALGADSKLVAGWMARSRLLLIEGDAEGAVVAAERAKQLEPDNHLAYIDLGDALIAAGRVEEGFAQLERGVNIGEGHIGARGRLARLLFDHGRLDEAAAEYGKLLAYKPDSPTALNNLGAISLSRGNYVDAIKNLKRLLEIKPDEYAASNLGTAYFYLDRMPEAIAAFHEAVQLSPGQPVLEQNLAEAYEKAGDAEHAGEWFATALTDYDRVLDGVGESMRAGLLAERAFCAAKLARFEEALANVDEALGVAADDMSCLRSAARVHALIGNREEAFGFLRRTVEAGYPAEELRRDPSFDAFREDPRFLVLLTEPGG